MCRTRGQCIRGQVFVLVSAYAAIALHVGQNGSDSDVIEVSSYTASDLVVIEVSSNTAGLSYSCLVSSRLPLHGQSGVFMSDLCQFCSYFRLKPAIVVVLPSSVFVANMSEDAVRTVAAETKSYPKTKSGHPVQWQVLTGQKFGCDQWLDFSAEDNWTIENSFGHNNKENVMLTGDSNETWTVDFSTFTQVNNGTGKNRAIRRIVIAEECTGLP